MTVEDLVQEARRLAGDQVSDCNEFLRDYIHMQQQWLCGPVENWNDSTCRHVARKAAEALCIVQEIPWGGR